MSTPARAAAQQQTDRVSAPARPHQELRPSQFMFTFGPGSVIETGSGPVIVKGMADLFDQLGRQPTDFEVTDRRLSEGLLGGARITRVPSNQELERPADQPVYPTIPFPNWALCTDHGGVQILYPTDRGCPNCRTRNYLARLKAGSEAIRFVRACENGHLDDVDWHFLVHGSSRCQPNHYLWEGGGRALRFVTLRCPKCPAQKNFGQAYGQPWHCSGRRREWGATPEACDKPAHILQRSAANLHIPEHETALTIIDMDQRQHRILTDTRILERAAMLWEDDDLTEERFRQRIVDNERAHVPDHVRRVLREMPWEELHAHLLRVLAGDHNVDRSSLRFEEFDFLMQAAEMGVPPIRSERRMAHSMFEVKREDVRTVHGPSGNYEVRVTPVSRLRVVIVQRGYRRIEPQGTRVVPVSFDYGASMWYPGVELFGEGIFLDLGAAPVQLTGSRVETWLSRWAADKDRPDQHPMHVWWHTLAHRLLRALSVDSGYSSASIRERVYLQDAGADGSGTGGLLLYTVQPGGDGTLGGLVDMSRRFEDVLELALDDLRTCSNDPLCAESPDAGASGASCYSCLLASETSCEWRNAVLDRLILLDNMP